MSPSIDGHDTPAAISSRVRHLWTWGGIGATSVLLVTLAVVAILKRTARVSIPVGIQTVVMPEGSLLVLREVTFGKKHRFQFEVQDRYFRRRPVELKSETNWPSAVLWFSHHGVPHLDRWAWSTVTDDLGHEHWISRGQHSSFSNFIVLGATIPTMRLSGATFQFRMFDSQNEEFAVFDVPNPFITKVIPEVWVAEPLPITKTVVDDVTLSLEGISGRPTLTQRHMRLSSLTITSQTQFRRGSQPIDDWQVFASWMTDPFRVSSYLLDCPLSTHEPVWQFTCQVGRKPSAEFPPDFVWEVGEFAIPGVGEETPVGLIRTLRGHEIRVSGLQGYVAPNSESPDQFLDVVVKVEQPNFSTVKHPPGVVTAYPDLQITDDNGRRIERVTGRPTGGFCYLLPKSAKTVKIRVTLNQHHAVKFFIEPPQVERTPGEP